LRHGLAEVAAFKGGERERVACTAVCVEKDEQTGRPKPRRLQTVRMGRCVHT